MNSQQTNGGAPSPSFYKTTGTFWDSPAVSGTRSFSSEAGEPFRPLTVLDADSKHLRDSVRKFAEEEVRPLVTKMDEEGKLSLDIVNALFQQGFMGMEVDKSEGGSGMSVLEKLTVVEELSRVDASVGLLVKAHNSLVLRAIHQHGTDEQKQHYLPKLCSDTVGSFCLSEAESGSDAFSLCCKASRDEERKGWVLNGCKQWISNAEEAGLFLIFATIDPDKEHKGICCFLVDADTEGLKIGKKCDKLGIRASSTCEVELNNVFVPENRVLGPLGEAYKLAANLLNESRIDTAALLLGVAQGAFNATIPYLTAREQFGKKLAEFQGVRFQAAELATDIEAVRLLIYNAAALKGAGLPFLKEAAMAKYKAARVAEKVASQCLEFFGGRGYTKEYPLEKYYRDAKIGAIYEGTSNIQLETIFKLVEKEYA